MSLLRWVQRRLEVAAFTPYAHAYAAAKVLHARRLQSRYLRRYPLRTLERLDPGRFKRSETLFIMGSGSSVSEYTAEEWAAIRAADSLGFNYWLIHDFVPDVYVIEPMRPPRDEAFYRLLAARAEDYRGVPFILKVSDSAELDIARVPPGIRDALHVSLTLPLPGSTPDRLTDAYTIYRERGLFEPGRPGNVIVQLRASVSGLVHLAVVWGYRRIVLCGVDLSDNAYFYEVEADRYRAVGRSVPEPGHLGPIHKTMDADLSVVTIDRVLYALDDAILKPQGIELHVALSSSALYPRLPAFFR